MTVTRICVGCVVAALVVLPGCRQKQRASSPPSPAKVVVAPTPPPATQPAVVLPAVAPAPTTAPQVPVSLPVATQPAPPPPLPAPVSLELPAPLARAAVGQWVRYRSTTTDRQERLVRVTGVNAELRRVELQSSLLDAAGQPVGEPKRSIVSMGDRPTRPAGAELTRQTIRTPAGEFDCVCVTLRGRDINNVQFVNRTWYSDRAPIEGIVKAEVVSGDRLERGEELIGLGS